MAVLELIIGVSAVFGILSGIEWLYRRLQGPDGAFREICAACESRLRTGEAFFLERAKLCEVCVSRQRS